LSKDVRKPQAAGVGFLDSHCNRSFVLVHEECDNSKLLAYTLGINGDVFIQLI